MKHPKLVMVAVAALVLFATSPPLYGAGLETNTFALSVPTVTDTDNATLATLGATSYAKDTDIVYCDTVAPPTSTELAGMSRRAHLFSTLAPGRADRIAITGKSTLRMAFENSSGRLRTSANGTGTLTARTTTKAGAEVITSPPKRMSAYASP